MKIAELLRTIADIVDAEQANGSTETISTTEIIPPSRINAPEEKNQLDLEQIMKLAGVARATTAPEVHVFPLTSAFPAGDDFHYSKNPADMRSDSVSLYPGYGAKK